MKLIIYLMSMFVISCGDGNRIPDLDEPLTTEEDADIPEEEFDEEKPEPEIDCPLTDGTIGYFPGDVMPPIRVRNSDMEVTALKDFCGSKTLLVVSSAGW